MVEIHKWWEEVYIPHLKEFITKEQKARKLSKSKPAVDDVIELIQILQEKVNEHKLK